jgi:hypothetical protein
MQARQAGLPVGTYAAALMESREEIAGFSKSILSSQRFVLGSQVASASQKLSKNNLPLLIEPLFPEVF